MAKLRYWFSFGFRLLAGIITGAALWAQFDALGLNAWRTFDTWIVLVATVYFFVSVIISWFHRKQPMPQPAICPLLQGFVLAAGVSSFILWLICYHNQLSWMGAQGIVAFLTFFLTPILMLIDWAVFSQKGKWSVAYPFYWLGIIISYCCLILLTADFVPDQSWAYPYTFLDYPSYGVDNLLCCSILMIVVVLLVGYVFMLLDFVASGQLGQHIVLPRIKTIVIEEPAVVESENAIKPELEEDKDSKKSSPAAKAKNETRPVEGLPDHKAAQKIHRPNKSKTAIIADIRLQVTGNKNRKPRQRPVANPNSKTPKKS